MFSLKTRMGTARYWHGTRWTRQLGDGNLWAGASQAVPRQATAWLAAGDPTCLVCAAGALSACVSVQLAARLASGDPTCLVCAAGASARVQSWEL